MSSLNNALSKLGPVFYTVARVLLGVVFFWHGLSKFRDGIDNVEAMFDGLGIPAPAVAAVVVAVIELVGGLALIVGIGTRVAAFLLGLVMVGALIYVKADLGITGGANTDLGLLAACLVFVGYGAGPISADATAGLDTATR